MRRKMREGKERRRGKREKDSDQPGK